MLYRQVTFERSEGRYTVQTTGWLRDQRLKVGLRCTLKHDRETVWTVAHISGLELVDPPAKDWKVGGLA